MICVRGYDRAHRVWHDKASTLAKYSIPELEAAKYEDDDLIPVCLERRGSGYSRAARRRQDLHCRQH